MRISIFTGIRRSEILFIERSDVNLDERFYRAVNIKSRDKHKVWREIPKQVYKDFKYFMDGSRSQNPFKVCTPNTFTQWTKKLLQEAGMSEDLHIHSLRHTYVTLGLEQGMSIRQMQKYIDHSSVYMTEIYAHDEAKKTPEIGLE